MTHYAKTLALAFIPTWRSVSFRLSRRGDLSSLISYVHRIANSGVAVVLRSENASFQPGEHLFANLRALFSACVYIRASSAEAMCVAFQQYNILKDTSRVRKLENKENLPWSVFLGVCGVPGELPKVRIVSCKPF